MMNPVPAPSATCSCGRRLRWFGPLKKGRRPSPPKKSVRSRVRCRCSVAMLTTIGVCAFAMLRNVVASTGPPRMGAVFTSGAATMLAACEDGARSSREAMTMPMAVEATAIRTA